MNIKDIPLSNKSNKFYNGNIENIKVNNEKKPPPKPPRTFAYDLFVSNNPSFERKRILSNEFSRRQSKSLENIYAEPKTFTDDLCSSDKKLRNRQRSPSPYMVTDLFNVSKQIPLKPAGVKDAIKQSFFALRNLAKFKSPDKIGSSDDDKSLVSMKEVQERIIYVQTLKLNCSQVSYDHYGTIEANNRKEFNLCRCCLVIKEPDNVIIIPKNIRLNNDRLIQELTNFKYLDHEFYWFTIWTKDDQFLYVYCLRQFTFQRRLCLVSEIYFPELFKRIMNNFSNREIINTSMIMFLKKNCTIFPGDELNFGYLKAEVPYDNMITSVGKLYNLLCLIKPIILFQAIATLLHERRVVLVSKDDQILLNSCRQLISLLYPLSWDYMFWPRVPHHLISLCSAINMPYVIGIKSNDIWKFVDLIKKKNDKLFIIDLDHNLNLMKVGDESKILPNKVEKTVLFSLDMCMLMNDPHDKYRDCLIREAFIQMFLQLIGTTCLYVTENSFNKEQFIYSFKSKSHQYFLRWFTETRLFHNFTKFIQLRLIQNSSIPKFSQFRRVGLFENKSTQLVNDLKSRHGKSLFDKLRSAI